MRVFIADPRAGIRAALTIFLELEPDLQIVGEAGDGAELLHGLAAARPDVVLLEWALLTAPLADLLTDLRARDLHPQVIVLSSRPEMEQAACAAGADGFVSKADLPSRLLTLLRGLALEHDRPEGRPGAEETVVRGIDS